MPPYMTDPTKNPVRPNRSHQLRGKAMSHAPFVRLLVLGLVVSPAVALPPPAFLRGVAAVSAAQDAATVEAALGLELSARRQIQQGLQNEGFDAGPPDGLFGPRTRSAIRRWQEAVGLEATGFLSAEQARRLSMTATPPSTAEPAASPAPVALEQAADAVAAVTVTGRAPTRIDTAQVSPALQSAGVPAGEGGVTRRPTTDAGSPTRLPPEILVDRYLLRAQRLLADGDLRAAQVAMKQVVALRREHGVTLPAEFSFRFAEVLFAEGRFETAIEHANQYLLEEGREGEFYRDALRLVDSAEEAVRRAEDARRRAEARIRAVERERQRVAALLAENEELARHQVAAATARLLRDPLRSGGVAPEMVTVAAGRFQYLTWQSYEPHLEWVRFDRPFAISKYEVTRGEFERFVDDQRYRTDAEQGAKCGMGGSGPTWKRPTEVYSSRRIDQSDSHPVVCVSPRDAMAYVEWLSGETGHTYRLPSPAEWQYAARAGSQFAVRHVHSRDASHDPTGRANLNDANGSSSDGVRHTAAVGSFLPNPIGVHDMIGNVSELVSACGRLSLDDGPFEVASNGAYESPGDCELGTYYMGGSYISNGPDSGARFGFTHYGSVNFMDLRQSPGGHEDVGFRVVRELQD